MNICMPSQKAEIHRCTAPFDNVFLNPESLTRPSDTGHDSHHREQSDYLCANEVSYSYNWSASADPRANRFIYSPNVRLRDHSNNLFPISGEYAR